MGARPVAAQPLRVWLLPNGAELCLVGSDEPANEEGPYLGALFVVRVAPRVCVSLVTGRGSR